MNRKLNLYLPRQCIEAIGVRTRMLHDDEGCERDILSPQQRSQSVQLVVFLEKTDSLVRATQIGLHIEAEAGDLLHLVIPLSQTAVVYAAQVQADLLFPAAISSKAAA